jgi:hypothetical protein
VGYRVRNTIFALLFVFLTGSAFSQTDEHLQRGSIPEELLRPRRDEAPRYPVDTVIGPIGQGNAPADAYGLARRIASALLVGNINAPVLSSVKRVFLEGYIDALNVVNPRYFRLGSGREEPDGSISFLVRFAGRELGITGELYIRVEERVTNPPPGKPVTEPPSPQGVEPEVRDSPIEPQPSPQGDGSPLESDAVTADDEKPPAAEAAEETERAYVPITEKRWIFEDLILESPRTREEEILENRQRYDFSPYERFF